MTNHHKPEVQENEAACDSATVDEVQYSCDYCSIIFKSIKALTIHLKRYHIKELLKFQCHLCEKYFEEYANLAYHMNVEHNTCPNCPCPHPCDTCQGTGLDSCCLECGTSSFIM